MPAQQVLLTHCTGTKAVWKWFSEYWTKIIQVWGHDVHANGMPLPFIFIWLSYRGSLSVFIELKKITLKIQHTSLMLTYSMALEPFWLIRNVKRINNNSNNSEKKLLALLSPLFISFSGVFCKRQKTFASVKLDIWFAIAHSSKEIGSNRANCKRWQEIESGKR